MSAVKKTQKTLNTRRHNKDEILDLLEKTANDSELNGSYTVRTPARKTSKATPKAKANNGQDDAAKVVKRTLKKVRSVIKKDENIPVEKAVEAKENGNTSLTASNANGNTVSKGILQRTMSSIWKMPGVGVMGTIPYDQVQETNGHAQQQQQKQQQQQQQQQQQKQEEAKNSCTIS